MDKVFEKVSVAVIGGGFVSEYFHLPALRVHEGVGRILLCEQKEARARELATRYDLAGAYTDYPELFDREKIDAVIVATPNDSHHPITMAAVDLGLAVLCEKPLALNVSEAREMLDAATRRNIVHGTSFTYRFVPALRRLKELVSEGYIGKPLQFINAHRYQGVYIEADMPVVWRLRKERAGTGVLGDLGSHLIDLARWLINDFDRVCGMMQTYPPTQRLPDSRAVVDVESDTSCAFLAELHGRTQAVIHLSQSAACRANDQHLELYGTEGVLVFDREIGRPNWVVGHLSGGKHAELFEPICLPDRLTAELAPESEVSNPDFLANRHNVTRAFVDAPLKNTDAQPDFLDGLMAQTVVEAVERASVERDWISVATTNKP